MDSCNMHDTNRCVGKGADRGNNFCVILEWYGLACAEDCKRPKSLYGVWGGYHSYYYYHHQFSCYFDHYDYDCYPVSRLYDYHHY